MLMRGRDWCKIFYIIFTGKHIPQYQGNDIDDGSTAIEIVKTRICRRQPLGRFLDGYGMRCLDMESDVLACDLCEKVVDNLKEEGEYTKNFNEIGLPLSPIRPKLTCMLLCRGGG